MCQSHSPARFQSLRRHALSHAPTVCTHAPGSRDFVAELITRNGSIRRSVMINPVETPLLRSVTCRAAPPPAAPPSLSVRSLSGAPGGLRACTRSPGSSIS
ncbi:hypothetical protein XENOCAPTIV_013662 [Xenoophorus captivus]|uniref:Uncharacterized protein n=1 Tax=Xenoophorus captivus TaxID=1517983 RepID=A0ABV0R1U6_9TELE